MNPLLLWLLMYVLPFAVAYVVVELSTQRWQGSISRNIVVVHIALLVSIIASQSFILAHGLAFPWGVYPWILCYAAAVLVARLSLGTFGLWYALSALIQQLTMLSTAFILLQSMPVWVVALLVAPVYAIAHFMRVPWSSARAGLFLAWGAASVALFVYIPSIWPTAALHTLFGALLIRRGFLYPESGRGIGRLS